MDNSTFGPGQKAKRTGQWAKTMTKWLIAYASRGGKRWQIVSFEGAKGGESRGIVDLLAIRKDHKHSKEPVKRGDLFEMILIQAKGGSAQRPSRSDVARLSKVKKYHRAKNVILAEWRKGKKPTLHSLVKSEWRLVDAKEVFK